MPGASPSHSTALIQMKRCEVNVKRLGKEEREKEREGGMEDKKETAPERRGEEIAEIICI